MERKRKYKMFSIVVLVVAIAGMTLGFAAFSKVLTITAGATVTPNEENFKIVLSGSKTDTEDLVIEPELVGGATADDGVIVNESSVSSLATKAYFTAPGQAVGYTFYIHNIGEYDGYLKKIEFLPAEGETLNKVCVPGVGTNETLVSQACESIVVQAVAVINNQEMTFYESIEFPENISTLKSTYGIGKLNVIYNEDGVRADGPFTVKIGGISIHYSTSN